MVVALESGLSWLEGDLKRAGHKVVRLENYRQAVDAVVYSEASLYEVQPVMENFSAQTEGILMISAKGLSSQEIIMRLEKKSIDGFGLF
ncbi:MAG: YkuS family protein [Clostridia bacterium]|nr:YkuS family protein [Clostridia bacterium]